MESRVQIDAIVSGLMTMAEESINITRIDANYQLGTVTVTVGD